MNRTLETTVGSGSAPVTVDFEVTTEEVDCYDRATGCDYTGTVAQVSITAIWMGKTDIKTALTDDVLTELEMECEASLSAVEA